MVFRGGASRNTAPLCLEIAGEAGVGSGDGEMTRRRGSGQL
jgi:hypothetical protein